MRKTLLAVMLLCIVIGNAQNRKTDLVNTTDQLTPGGFFDQVFDQYGNKFRITEMQAPVGKPDRNGNVTQSLPGCSSGIFNLYFETGSGMENSSDPVHLQRRAVVCAVFLSVSNMIVTPPGTIVNIGVKNLNSYPNVPANVLGLATAIYTAPNHTNGNFGGIIDSEMWKTMHTGQDSYAGIMSPLSATTVNAGQSGIFYHGVVAFNFGGTFNWNTNTSINCPPGMYDLYSVALHEVAHGLGFHSLINNDGSSILGPGFNYFTRYDRFLKNNSNTQFLIGNAGACSNMYNYSYVLNPLILSPSTACQNNNTVFSNALRYVSGTQNIPVYTPNCYEHGSSLSHLEDQWYTPPAGFPSGNDQYFALSNAEPPGATKRILRNEERRVLCDIGYTLTSSGGVSCSGITVAGRNDGINSTGYAYSGNASANITISGLLANDSNATQFECLMDVYATSAQPTSLSVTTGTSSTNVVFNSSTPGVHLLRYVPRNAAGVRGNITYVFVYVDGPGCATPNPCSLIMNGNFEQHMYPPSNYGQIAVACGWQNGNGQSVDYFNADATNSNVDVPCNRAGFINDNIPGNSGYAGMVHSNNGLGTGSREIIATTLKEPLLPNKTYELSFDLSLANASSSASTYFQAYFSNGLVPGATASFNVIPIPNPSMLYTTPFFCDASNAWQTVKMTIQTTTGGENILYLGGLTNLTFQAANVVPTPSCDLGIAATAYYYLDNVSLVPTYGASLNLPAVACSGTSLNNLGQYLTSAPAGGIFTGPGVTSSGGTYSFNAANAGLGIHTLVYTYTTAMGCSTTVSDTIEVTSGTLPIFGQVGPRCFGSPLFSLPMTSQNGITGTWSPQINTTATTTYTFTPNPGQCASSTSMTIVITLASAAPIFTQVAAICQGTILAPLPNTSNNGITGSWSPAMNSSATTTYTFTPDPGQCAVSTTMTITVNRRYRPTFDEFATYCYGTTNSPLPLVSANGIPGTWSPAWNGYATTTYTFTASPGICSYTATATIQITPPVVPTFNAIAPLCAGSVSPLPPVSTNGIAGTWYPAWNGQSTTIYTFTPNAGQCATSIRVRVEIYPQKVPNFRTIAPMCEGVTNSPLPTVSMEGVPGTWSPVWNPYATTTYTFTPNPGFCYTTGTVTVTIIPTIQGTFDPVGPICPGTILTPLPTTANNGVTGTWSPALNNLATTWYTFTPTPGQCAKATTLQIVVLPETHPDCCTTCVRTREIPTWDPKEPSALKVAPNPAGSFIQLQLQNATFSHIVVIAMDGKTVLERKGLSGNDTTLDVSALADGVYNLSVEASDGSRYTHKLIKKN